MVAEHRDKFLLDNGILAGHLLHDFGEQHIGRCAVFCFTGYGTGLAAHTALQIDNHA